MRFLKYEFPIDKWQELKPLLESNPNAHFVEIGELIEGKQAVDVYYDYDEIVELSDYKVFPNPCGVHTFLGCEGLYEIEYNRYNS